MSLTRTASGKIAYDDMSSLSGLYTTGGVSLDTSKPLFVFHPSTIVAADPSISTNLAGGVREPEPLVLSDSLRYLFVDGGDDTGGSGGPWRVQLLKSTDHGITWSRVGDLAGLTQGSHKYYCMSGWVTQDSTLADTKYYIQILIADNDLAANVPGSPYGNQVYATSGSGSDATQIEGTWTFQNETPTLGSAGSFDEKGVPVGGAILVGGTWHGYYSSINSDGSLTNFGHATASHLNGTWTKDGAGALLPSGIRDDALTENPKIWNWAAESLYVILGNPGGDDGKGDLWFSTSLTDWSGAYRQRVVEPVNFNIETIATTVSVLSPSHDANGIPLTSDWGQIGLYFACEPNPSGTPLLHQHIRQGTIDPRPGAAMVTGSLDFVMHNVAHDDAILEFEMEVQGTCNNVYLALRYASNSDSAGYLLGLRNGSLLLQMPAATTLATASGQPAPYATVNSTNRWIQRCRVKMTTAGGIQQWVEGDQILNYTTSLSVTSGNYFGFRVDTGSSVPLRGITAYKAETVTVNGLNNGDVVGLHGAGGVVFDNQTASGGAVTLTSTHYPLAYITVNGVKQSWAQSSDGIFGGDAFSLDASGGVIGHVVAGGKLLW